MHDYIYEDADDTHHHRNDNDDDNDDEQAWLSINSRLELPSLSASSSRLVSRRSLLLLTALNPGRRSTSPSLLRRTKSRTEPEPEPEPESERLRRQHLRPGYHRRSLTTPFPLMPRNLPMMMTTTAAAAATGAETEGGREGSSRQQQQRPTPPHRSSSS
jgi:hypothetical protein